MRLLSPFNNHPFAVVAHFDHSAVLTFAYPKEQLAELLPECLTLDTHNDKWAFVAVAIVQTKGLRPKGFPSFLGHDFLVTGYRVFVKYIDNKGKRLRGLYILRSETNKKIMETLGSIFTRYKYFTTDVTVEKLRNTIKFTSNQSDFEVLLDLSTSAVNLPKDSTFTDWKEARRFAGPLPYTFSYDANTRKVLIVEGVRQNWTPQPVSVLRHCIPYLSDNGLKNGVLASAFIIDNIPYVWKKGRTELWES